MVKKNKFRIQLVINKMQTYGVIARYREQLYVSNHILYVNGVINWQQEMGNRQVCFSPSF
ncbi:hypothetical protein A4R26_01860 [Niastella populi]|uniref:Uncharacterized protein n=1 Tax=Niastella populi TaxID=550983 RepID=A0A1V9GD16_9BACT|nr:hypothetical protein A4R26_01860 [Niastella populi]